MSTINKDKLGLVTKAKTQEDIKEDFFKYLTEQGRRENTVRQYITKIPELQKWFIENKIVEPDYNIWTDKDKIGDINARLNNDSKKLWMATNKQIKHWFSAPWRAWTTFNGNKPLADIIDENEDFDHKSFYQSAQEFKLILSDELIIRFVASILTKPFVVLTGLSGSGKTKLAQAFAMWICEDDNQYCIVPVGADWTNREPLLGFPNALEKDKYVKPENGVLDLIIAADADQEKPYFLILDEMNLSHVERYFADFLSVMESNGKISLHPGQSWDGIPPQIYLPKNLFIIGTVNIDETTYMFSPKVLDRANVIEFRVTADEMKNYLSSTSSLDLEQMNAAGANMAGGFVEIALDKSLQAKNTVELQTELLIFFTELKRIGAEFGFRSASEIMRFAAIVNTIEPAWKDKRIIDAAIMQKLLPKVHGSRRKLEPVLKTLGTLCLATGQTIDEFINIKTEIDFNDTAKIKYPISFEKILRMYRGLMDNGFTSYAEA